MKIGILTLPLHTNYGGILQAYALMTVLKNMGHEVWLIDRQQNKKSKWRYPLAIIKRTLLHYVFNKKNQTIFIEKQLAQDFLVKTQFTQQFINNHIHPRTKAMNSTVELSEINNQNFDICIVGSDQVWRPAYAPNIENYFFNFLSPHFKGSKIAYAASFGSDEWLFSPSETKKCGALLRQFKNVSVRESTAVDMCQNKFNVETSHVLDPTMLLNKDDYTSLIDNLVEESKGELLVYLLDITDEKQILISRSSKYLGLKPFFTNNIDIDNEAIQIENRIAPPVEKWIKGFVDAQFVITDSFHACVFAILFNKPFIVYGNTKRGMTRFHSLLKIFELEDRLILSLSELTEELVNTPINWNNINRILEEKKKESIEYLTRALEK